MSTTSDVRPIDVPPPDPQWRRWMESGVARRLVGIALIVVVAGGFFLAGDFSRLDTVREDVSIATAVDVARAGVPADQVSNCFQGFCFEDDVGFLQRWWEFSITYLGLIWPGFLMAAVVAGIVDGFLLRTGEGPAYGSWSTSLPSQRTSLTGTSILHVGTDDDLLRSIVVGALGGPALAMSVVLFSPSVWLTRVGLALAIVVPLLLWRGRSSALRAQPTEVGAVVAAGDAGRAAWRFGVRLAPLFVIAAFLGGLGTQYLTVDGVESVAGGHVLGVLLAAAVGLAIDLPLTFGLPVAALGLLVGVDPIVAAVFLVTATLTGPRALAAALRGSGARLLAVSAVALALVGSLGALGAAEAALAATGGPRIAWDGDTCTYRGPGRFGPGVHDFALINDTEDLGEGHTMAVVIGEIPSNVSIEHLDATVAADRTAPLPPWFTVAGNHEFIFPGTEVDAEITLHAPGTYAAVCLDGGGFYVIFEFSMPQPMGWFDEFRSTFDGYVADRTFTVAG